MLESLKSLWARWKVQVTVIGGVLVVATAYGTCSFDPQTVSEVSVEPAVEVTTAISMILTYIFSLMLKNAADYFHPGLPSVSQEPNYLAGHQFIKCTVNTALTVGRTIFGCRR